MDSASQDDPLQLVFSGECLEGHDPQAVREAVAGALNLDEKRAARMFSGKRVVLQRRVDAATARRHIARFAMMGALVRAEPLQPPPQPPSPEADLAKEAPARAVGARPWRRLRRASRRLVRWGGIGLLSIVLGVGFGLVLGPGLNSPWSDEPPVETRSPAVDGRPGPAPVAPAVVVAPPAKPRPAVAPTVPAPAEAPKGMTAEAMREYRHAYLPAKKHKAFSISSRGSHAWVAGAPSENEAREGAIAGCISTMPPDDDGCRIVDADGEWVD